MQRWISTVLVLCVAGTARAQDPTKGPKGTAPRFGTVMSVDTSAGLVSLTHQHTIMVPIQVLKVRNVGGEQITETKTEYRVETRTMVSTTRLEGTAVTDASGKKLTKKEALNRLKVGGIVLQSPNGKPIDRAYLTLFEDGVIVLGVLMK